MSYILDALRRADAERERDRSGVPGLHAQPVPLLAPEAPAARRPPLVWLSGGLALALVAVLGWQWLGRAPADEPRADAPAARPPASSTAGPGSPAPAVSGSPAPALADAPAARVAPPTPSPPRPARDAGAAPAVRDESAAARARPRPAAEPAEPIAATPPRARPVPERSEPPAPAPTGAATAVAPPAAPPDAARVPTLRELPEALRRELPALVIGGSIYSPNPPDRILIVNGQLAHERDALAPDLVLEQIGSKSAVLRFKGQQFQIAY